MTENEALLLVSIPACRKNVSKILAFRCFATLKLLWSARLKSSVPLSPVETFLVITKYFDLISIFMQKKNQNKTQNQIGIWRHKTTGCKVNVPDNGFIEICFYRDVR